MRVQGEGGHSMRGPRMSDEEIIDGILNGSGERMKAIRALYERTGLKDRIRSFVMRNKGTADDAEDIYHDGIIALDRNVRKGAFREESPLEAYLYSICRFTWMNTLRKRQKIVHPDRRESSLNQIDPEKSDDEVHREEMNRTLDHLLEQVSERCRAIFALWKLDYSMAEIADRLELSSPRLVRKYKYRCMKRLVDFLEKHPGIRKTAESVLYG